jgi:hypothetical protein
MLACLGTMRVATAILIRAFIATAAMRRFASSLSPNAPSASAHTSSGTRVPETSGAGVYAVGAGVDLKGADVDELAERSVYAELREPTVQLSHSLVRFGD